MGSYSNKSKKTGDLGNANNLSDTKAKKGSSVNQTDNSPQTLQLRKLQEMTNDSNQIKQYRVYQQMAKNNSAKQTQANGKETAGLNSQENSVPVQKKENHTGLPDQLKGGIENLSGYSLDDAKVHYNSSKPAQLNAHAYAQGTEIHLSPGQEKHLPHEAWHVVQQKQGRVQATRQMKEGVPINDDAGLEKEADMMGSKALQMHSYDNHNFNVVNGEIGNQFDNSSVTQLVINKDDFFDSGLPSLSQTYLGYLAILQNFIAMYNGSAMETPENVLFAIETWKVGLKEIRRMATQLSYPTPAPTSSNYKYIKPLIDPYKSGLVEMETELQKRVKPIKRLLSNKDIARDGQSREWFFNHFTILPGLNFSITFILNNEQSSAKKEEVDRCKLTFENDSLRLRDQFLGTYHPEAIEFNKKSDLDDIINTDPYYGLADLNVMHPHTPSEAKLIAGIDHLNSEFNITISRILNTNNIDQNFIERKSQSESQSTDSEAENVKSAGGLVANHSLAFQSMLTLRGSAGVTIRPAGKHSVGLLSKNYAAKPLWVKGKTIDLSKLTIPQLNTLRRYLRKLNPEIIPITEIHDVNDKPGLIGVLQKVITEGLIPSDQLLSKWLRDIEIGKPNLKDLPVEDETSGGDSNVVSNNNTANEGQEEAPALSAGALMRVMRMAASFRSRPLHRIADKAKAANAPIEEMAASGLIGLAPANAGSASHSSSITYVTPPKANALAYTGDYDMYGIMKASTEAGKLNELRKLTLNARQVLGNTNDNVDHVTPQIAADAHRSMAEEKSEGVPNAKHAHKLFGNISPFEIGMMLDLNAAAAAWGGYTGGQVIKHGAESGNFQYPQAINDGIVSVGPDHVNFDSETKDDAKGVNFVLVLQKMAFEKKWHIDSPINPTLMPLYEKLKAESIWNTAAQDPLLWDDKTINLKRVRNKIENDSELSDSRKIILEEFER